jgi:hypothetical protein
MKLLLTKLENIALTIITILLILYPSYLLFLVRLGDYIVNLCDFYSYKLIWKVTAFFAASGVHLAETNSGLFHFRRVAFSSHWRGAYHFKNTYSPITLTNISSINLVIIFRCFSSPTNPVHVRRVDSSALVFSLSSYRHSYRFCL